MTSSMDNTSALTDDELERALTTGAAFAFAGPQPSMSAAGDGAAGVTSDAAVGAVSAAQTSESSDDFGDAEALFESAAAGDDDSEFEADTANAEVDPEPDDEEQAQDSALEASAPVPASEGDPVEATTSAADDVDANAETVARFVEEFDAPQLVATETEVDGGTDGAEPFGVTQYFPGDGGAAGTSSTITPSSNVTIGGDLALAVGDSVTFGVTGGLTFTLNNTGGVGIGSAALAGFQAGALLWSNIFNDDINIVLDVGFQDLGSPFILAQAGSSRISASYSNVRTALQGDSTSADDATAVANLQGGSSLSLRRQNDADAIIIDNDGGGTNSTLAVNRANAKALGLLASNDAGTDASITFNSTFAFDLDRSNGIQSNQFDFIGIAAHEIGHALGFVSGVDSYDFIQADPNGDGLQISQFDNTALLSVLDLFRESTTTAGNASIDVTYGTSSFFSLDNGATNSGFLSTGSFNGDGEQASHFRDNLGLGILDPTAAPGELLQITQNDISALDAIGFNVANIAPARPVEVFNSNNLSGGTFDTIAEAVAVINISFRVVVSETGYTANPENVTVEDDNTTFVLPTGVTPTITADAGVQTITLEGTGAGNLIGSAARNILIGNDGANRLDDGGGGNDILSGRSGDDVYVVNSSTVQVIEISGGPGGGNDRVESSVSYIISDNDVENITLTGTADIDALGNNVANVIIGNDGANGLAGGNGADLIIGGAGNDSIDGQNGADIMRGGTGSDGYNVDRIDDVIEEDFNGGEFDIVRTAVSLTLPDNVEIGILKGGASNPIDIIGNDGPGDNIRNLMLGNDSNNTITTGGGQDVILGRGGIDTISAGAGRDNIAGGAGADILTGGAGDDLFNFTAITDAGDTITDFTIADTDVLDLRALFDTFTGGSALDTNTAQTGGYLNLVDNGNSITVQVDADGGANNFVDLVLLQNVTDDVTAVDNFILV